jgi:trk system potassium uptake protein TrkH
VGLFVGRIALKERIVLKELLDIDSFAGLLNLLKKIVAIVLLIEGIGAILLCIAFMRQYPFMSALYLGIFHSVSAFCNAGISVFSANVEGYSRSAFVLLTIAALIIVGGIGFTVLVELTEFGRKRIGRLSLHTRIVLIMTAVLIVSGLILFWLFEANNVLKDTGAGYSLLNSFFQSVTTRTAGFDSILPALYTRATSIIMIILMFIGASPGGTGGGIKTTTFFIVLLFASTMVKDRSDVVTGRRRISEDIVQKALAVFIWSIFFIVTVTTVMTLFEPGLFIDILFEVVSAFGTVGLSRGITPGLTIAGKLLIIATMIIGRVGILTFLMALLKNEKEQILVRYPEEKVMIG